MALSALLPRIAPSLSYSCAPLIADPSPANMYSTSELQKVTTWIPSLIRWQLSQCQRGKIVEQLLSVSEFLYLLFSIATIPNNLIFLLHLPFLHVCGVRNMHLHHGCLRVLFLFIEAKYFVHPLSHYWPSSICVTSINARGSMISQQWLLSSW